MSLSDDSETSYSVMRTKATEKLASLVDFCLQHKHKHEKPLQKSALIYFIQMSLNDLEGS